MPSTTLPGLRRNLRTAIPGAALAIGLALATLALIAVEVRAKPGCGGRKATIVRGAGNDVIKAVKHGPQVIVAGGGNDTIIAKRNKDIVCAGDGNDFISGGTGRDKLFGEAGNDVIDEGPGSGKAFAGPGEDTLLGGGGGDSFHGDDGNDRIFGQIQDDHLRGDSGDDLIVGGQGIDQMEGGGGDDWLRGGVNNDLSSGNDGDDTLSFGSATPPGPADDLNGVTVDLSSGRADGDDSPERLSGIENLMGSPSGGRRRRIRQRQRRKGLVQRAGKCLLQRHPATQIDRLYRQSRQPGPGSDRSRWTGKRLVERGRERQRLEHHRPAERRRRLHHGPRLGRFLRGTPRSARLHSALGRQRQ
jgi:RTX calcium-binding nonapeptide repeat (4 copies)